VPLEEPKFGETFSLVLQRILSSLSRSSYASLTALSRYDDADTLAWKYQAIARHGLGGGGMWAANMLDYTQPSAFEVWNALLSAVAVA
jgi:hypothetical protein